MKPPQSSRLAVLLATAICSLSAQAAFVFTGAGQTVTTQFSGTSQGVNLAASVTYTLASYSTAQNSKNAVFDVTVSNSTGAQAGRNLLASFGVDVISPSLTSVSDTFSGFTSTRSAWFQGANNRVDLCLYASGSCSQPSDSGLSEASSQKGRITLGFDNSAFSNGFSLSFAEPYYVRFVSVGSGNDDDDEDSQVNLTCRSSANCATASTVNAVPEPASLLLVGAGLLAVGLVRRRRA